MYSYLDENFIMNSIDNNKLLYYYSKFNSGEFDGVIVLDDLDEFLAALDEYVTKNPRQIDSIVEYLMEVVRNPQEHIDGMVADQHFKATPRILAH